MSIKMAVAKLSATAAGVALMTGGAVRVAEPMVTDDPQFTTAADGKLLEATPVQISQPRYVKTDARVRDLPPLPEPERRRRIVERTIECQPVGVAFPTGTPIGPSRASATVAATAPLPAGATRAYIDAAECPPITQVAYAPAPLPPLPPIRGGGGFGGGPVVVGGSGGFGGGFGGGGFFGGFFGGGGSSSGDVSVVSTTTTGGGDVGGSSSTSTSGGTTGGSTSDGININIDIDNSTSSGTISSTTGGSGTISSTTGGVTSTSSTGTISS